MVVVTSYVWSGHFVSNSRCGAERGGNGDFRLDQGEAADLLRLLPDYCPKRKPITVCDLGGVHCPELPGFFLPTAP
jgi:hypothetical protein